jgi:hypothetical protein
VLIADDQALVRAGFRMILEAEQDIEVVGEAVDGGAALEEVRRVDAVQTAPVQRLTPDTSEAAGGRGCNRLNRLMSIRLFRHDQCQALDMSPKWQFDAAACGQLSATGGTASGP